MTDDTFDAIVAGFYRAASGAIGWVDALVPFQRAMAAVAVYLHGVDVAQGRIAFSHAANDMPAESELDYLRTYHRVDPRTEMVIGGEPGVWFNCWDYFDDAFVAKNPFYQQFLIPYGGRYVSGMKLLQDDDVCAIVGVHRGMGSPRLDLQEIATCQRLASHLTGALTMYRGQLKLHQQRRLGDELLARLRTPVLLIDDERRIQQANPAARALVATTGAVFERGGRLYCRRPSDDGTLLQGLRRLLWSDGAVSPHADDGMLFVRARPSTGDKAIGLYIEALRPEKTLHVFGERPLAMVTLHDPDERLRLDPFMVATAFGLTPAEAKIAVAIAKGASAEQIAKQHRTSIHTVRSQVRKVLQKTGTTRQAEMVGVLAGLPTR